MKQKYVKKCLALLVAGMMTVSTLSMGSLPVLAADGTEDEVVTYIISVTDQSQTIRAISVSELPPTIKTRQPRLLSRPTNRPMSNIQRTLVRSIK